MAASNLIVALAAQRPTRAVAADLANRTVAPYLRAARGGSMQQSIVQPSARQRQRAKRQGGPNAAIRGIDRHGIDADRAQGRQIDADLTQQCLRFDTEEFTADFVVRPGAAFEQDRLAA